MQRRLNRPKFKLFRTTVNRLFLQHINFSMELTRATVQFFCVGFFQSSALPCPVPVLLCTHVTCSHVTWTPNDVIGLNCVFLCESHAQIGVLPGKTHHSLFIRQLACQEKVLKHVNLERITLQQKNTDFPTIKPHLWGKQKFTCLSNRLCLVCANSAFSNIGKVRVTKSIWVCHYFLLLSIFLKG